MPPAVAEPRAGLGSDAEFHTGKAACKHLAVTALSPRSHGSANGCAEPRHGPAAPHSPPGGSRDLPGSPRQRTVRGGGDLRAHPVPTPSPAAGPRVVRAGAATPGSPQ